MAWLREVDSGRAVEIGELASIGRDASNQLCLGDPLVAARHAEVRLGPDGRYRLVDLGSRHGTFHGTRRVSEVMLENGDQILVGGSRLRFEVEAPAGATKASPSEETGAAFPPASEISDLARLRDNYEQMRASLELTRLLAEASDVRSFLGIALDAAMSELGGDRGLAMVLNPTTRQPLLQIVRTRSDESGGFSLSTGMLSEVMRRRSGLLVADPSLQANATSSLAGQMLQSALCVPAIHRGQIHCVFLIGSCGDRAFAEKDLARLERIAAQTAPALERAVLADRVLAVAAEESRRLDRLISDLPDGVVLLDSTRHVSMSNPKGAELLALLTSAGTDLQVEWLGVLLLSDVLEQQRLDAVVPGPPRRVLELRATEARTADGSEVVLVLRDVTEEREHEARLAQQDRLAAVGQLVGGVAHDFNNLLAVISNYALFVREAANDPQVREDAAAIEEAAGRATKLVKQLLAFGRRDSVRPRVVKLEQVVEGMRQMLTRLLGAGIKLVLSNRESQKLNIDPARLEQVVLNLAVNGRDAMSGQGTLTISTGPSAIDNAACERAGLAAGRYCELVVRDGGVGMTPEIQARIFEAFFTTKEQGKGTGLGLATVFAIVKQAGGAVLVESTPFKGSEFRVVLPATEAPSYDSRPILRSIQGGQETVLVAEDEDSVRELMRRILSSVGYRVIDAPSGDAALELAHKHGPIDLLVTDLVMPGLGGKELARRLRELNPQTRVLYVSGYFGGGEESGAPADAPFLAKPFTREQLLAQARVALDPSVPEGALP